MQCKVEETISNRMRIEQARTDNKTHTHIHRAKHFAEGFRCQTKRTMQEFGVKRYFLSISNGSSIGVCNTHTHTHTHHSYAGRTWNKTVMAIRAQWMGKRKPHAKLARMDPVQLKMDRRGSSREASHCLGIAYPPLTRLDTLARHPQRQTRNTFQWFVFINEPMVSPRTSFRLSAIATTFGSIRNGRKCAHNHW